MSKKYKNGGQPSRKAAPAKQNGRKSGTPTWDSVTERIKELNAKWDPHNLRTQLKPGVTRIIASGTGFNTAGKKPAEKANPELEKLSKNLGLTVQDIRLLSELFPPRNP